MKKILTLLLAFVCALSAAVFSACYQTKLSEEDWAAVVSAATFSNVTITYSGSSGSGSSAVQEEGSIKVNLSYNGSSFTGEAYADFTETTQGVADADGDYVIYERYLEDGYEMVCSVADGSGTISWSGTAQTGARQAEESRICALSDFYSYINMLAAAPYGSVSYYDGVYTYTQDGETLELTYLSGKTTMLKVSSSSKSFKYRLAAYGTTSVAVDSEYLYENYSVYDYIFNLEVSDYYSSTIEYSSSTVTETDTYTTEEEEAGTLKADLTEDGDGVTGVMYASCTLSYLRTSHNGTMSYNTDGVYYENYLSDSYELVLSYADTGSSDLSWSGIKLDGAQPLENSFITEVTEFYSYMEMLTEATYDDLSENGGVYTYIKDGITLQITDLEDGTVTLNVISSVDGVTKNIEYKITDIGATSITIPDEYTYEYYSQIYGTEAL